MSRPGPSLPRVPPLPPRPPKKPGDLGRTATSHAPSNRKIRPLVYAIGVAGIVGSGALIGAILKMRQESEAQNARNGPSDENPSSQPSPEADRVDYARHIEVLETRRANLVSQKLQLERKIQALHESQRQKAEEEELKRELKMNK